MKLLLHTCCAPCSTYVVHKLRADGYKDITSLWYNINIHPYEEYQKRLETLKQYAQMIDLPLIVEDQYGLREFTQNVSHNIDGRCVYCYEKRMDFAAKLAKENGYDAFSTTLLVSPYQKHELLVNIAESMAKKYDTTFLYQDFRPGFRVGQQMAKEAGLYMQKYCGCVYSEEESKLLQTAEDVKLPEDFEFLPVTREIVIKKEKASKDKYMDLLLEADPNEKLVTEYLDKGDLFVLSKQEEIICIAVVIKVDDNTCELKNLVTNEKYRGQGYAKKMIKYLTDNYKMRYQKMLVGTSENNIPFYVKQGFERYEKTIKNFFIDNYEEELWDGDLKCVDMYYYSKDLKKTT